MTATKTASTKRALRSEKPAKDSQAKAHLRDKKIVKRRRSVFGKKQFGKPAKLRASITPGTILILLHGRFRGKRVVFLRQLPSGLLLVTGPRRVNGVPLRRINQNYVIATSTKIDISHVKLPEIKESMFKPKRESGKDKKDMFDAEEQEKKELSPERKKLQMEIDEQLLEPISKVPDLRSYLKATFTLKKGQAPHQLKF